MTGSRSASPTEAFPKNKNTVLTTASLALDIFLSPLFPESSDTKLLWLPEIDGPHLVTPSSRGIDVHQIVIVIAVTIEASLYGYVMVIALGAISRVAGIDDGFGALNVASKRIARLRHADRTGRHNESREKNSIHSTSRSVCGTRFENTPY
jgi:hypothetical protein